MFSSSNASSAIEKEKGLPTDVGHNSWWHMKCAQHAAHNPKFEQGKSEGFDICDWPSNLTQIGFESSIFQPLWPRNLMDDPEK